MGATENKQLIKEAFAAWEHGDYEPFFKVVAEDVQWTVIGSTAISGTFSGKRAFLDGAVVPMHEQLAEPIAATVVNVFGDGDHVILQWNGTSVGKNGQPYEQMYCWVMRLSGGLIVEVTAYLDTGLVADMFS